MRVIEVCRYEALTGPDIMQLAVERGLDGTRPFRMAENSARASWVFEQDDALFNEAAPQGGAIRVVGGASYGSMAFDLRTVYATGGIVPPRAAPRPDPPSPPKPYNPFGREIDYDERR